MDPVQIIFFDIDGTLVDPATGKIPEKTFEALHLLRKKGILLCIATGRPTASLPDFGGFPFDAMCTFNGSLCYCGDAIIHSHPIDPEDVHIVLGNAAKIKKRNGPPGGTRVVLKEAISHEKKMDSGNRAVHLRGIVFRLPIV